MAERTSPYRTVDDRELVIAFKAGEPGAYEEMYRRYSGRVGNVCRRMLANRDDAQEAVQETFLKAYIALPEFNGNYRLGAWLGRIASNVCVDLLRARARSANVVPLHPDTSALAVESSPEQVVVGDGPEVDRPMADIQPLHARALMMRGVEGLSHREIAGKLSMSPAQVKALLHRARRSFKRSWDEAKGWAIAPVLVVRNVARQMRDATQAGSQLAGASATVGPMLAERVAASAMIVAVLSGMPAASPVGSPASRAEVVRRPQVNEWGLTAPHAVAHEARVDAPRDTRSAAEARARRSKETGHALVSGVDKVLTRARAAVGAPPKERGQADEHEGLVPIGSKEEAGRVATRVVEEVEDLIETP
ncbi:MAG TPA: RNA polymerase sigma factor [Actinomycetota bacterium]|jgi:RNA polymerase sigma-70 factor (ECF subfamily)